MRWLRRLASTRLTLVGMLLLAIGAGLSYDNPEHVSVWVLATPMVLLALNLSAAIVVYPAINRSPGLLIFHLGLLAICVLAAIGRLTYYEAHVEMSKGQVFDALAANDVQAGPLHFGDLHDVSFVQGPWTVDYTSRLTRGPTRSHVLIPDEQSGWQDLVIGDDTPLVLEGYRFYTTFNKGFAAVLTWIPDEGERVTGTIHMPSYPLFDYKQSNSWEPPGGQEIKFWLRLQTAYDVESSWVLDENTSSAKLVVNTGDERHELDPGQAVPMEGGQLRYDELTTWMGYLIYYDPTLFGLFVAAMLTVAGLSFHYWRKFASSPLTNEVLHQPNDEPKRDTSAKTTCSPKSGEQQQTAQL